jgi:hypothetical protein
VLLASSLTLSLSNVSLTNWNKIMLDRPRGPCLQQRRMTKTVLLCSSSTNIMLPKALRGSM